MKIRSLAQKLAVFLLFVVLAACQSADRSYALTESILEQMPIPDGAVQICTIKIERLAKMGMGTHFGVRALYGANIPQSTLLDQQLELLGAAGWQNYTVTSIGSLLFCHSDYRDISLSVTELAVFDQEEIGIPQDILSRAEKTYRTTYVVTIVRFPFDEMEACE